jgi:hypothetical protein
MACARPVIILSLLPLVFAERGPGGGDMRSIAVRGTTLIAGVAGGGVFRSTNNGTFGSDPANTWK